MTAPIIMSQKNVGVTDMFMYLVKVALYFDTSELYTCSEEEKIQSGGNRNNSKKGFDLYEFFFEDDTIKTLVGGAKVLIGGNETEETEAEIEEEEETEEKKKFSKEMNSTIKKAGSWITDKAKGILIFILFASIYPAIPFFAVMAVMFAIFKWILWKIRKL